MKSEKWPTSHRIECVRPIVPSYHGDSVEFRVTLDTGDEADVSARALCSYHLFKIEVLAQCGLAFRCEAVEKRRRRWEEEVQEARYGKPLAVLEAAAWRKRALDRSH